MGACDPTNGESNGIEIRLLVVHRSRISGRVFGSFLDVSFLASYYNPARTVV